jgi:hypothetical protein
MNSLLYVVENWFSILTDCVGALGQGGLGQFYGRLIVDNTAYPYATDNGYDNLQVVGVQNATTGYGIYCPQYVVAGYAGARTLGATGTDGVNTFYGGLVTTIGTSPAAIWTWNSGTQTIAWSGSLSALWVDVPDLLVKGTAGAYNGDIQFLHGTSFSINGAIRQGTDGTLHLVPCPTASGGSGEVEVDSPATFYVASAVSATVPLAKLTIGGTQGSLTISGGIVTAYTAPT